MEKNNISFAGLTAAPNQRIRGWVPVLDTGYEMPVTVINGAFDGPTVLITSGIHGGEYPGIQTAIELSGCGQDPRTSDPYSSCEHAGIQSQGLLLRAPRREKY